MTSLWIIARVIALALAAIIVILAVYIFKIDVFTALVTGLVLGFATGTIVDIVAYGK